MHTEYSGRNSNPFGSNGAFWTGTARAALLDQMLDAIRSHHAFLVLTGSPGTGKTRFLGHAATFLEQSGVLCVSISGPAPADRAGQALAEIGALILNGASDSALDKAVRTWHRRNGYQRPAVLMINQGDVLDDGTLLRLARVPAPVQVLLAGRPALSARLAGSELLPVRERITGMALLDPLSHAEVADYIAWKIQGANRRVRFNAAAVAWIAVRSQGLFQRIDALCADALHRAYRTGTVVITPLLLENRATRAIRPSGIRPAEAMLPQNSMDQVLESLLIQPPSKGDDGTGDIGAGGDGADRKMPLREPSMPIPMVAAHRSLRRSAMIGSGLAAAVMAATLLPIDRHVVLSGMFGGLSGKALDAAGNALVMVVDVGARPAKASPEAREPEAREKESAVDNDGQAMALPTDLESESPAAGAEPDPRDVPPVRKQTDIDAAEEAADADFSSESEAASDAVSVPQMSDERSPATATEPPLPQPAFEVPAPVTPSELAAPALVLPPIEDTAETESPTLAPAEEPAASEPPTTAPTEESVTGNLPESPAESPADAPVEETAMPAPPPSVPDPASTPTPPPTEEAALTEPPAAPATVAPAMVRPDPARPDPAVTKLLERGRRFLDLGDVTSARLFYETAAARGSAEAATAVGMTHDPQFLRQIGARGIASDPEKAAQWYEKGRELGDPQAERRLQALNRSVAR
jgi:type II secretory pathway predicted ATPase ExeA